MKAKLIKLSLFLNVFLITMLAYNLNGGELEPNIKEPRDSSQPYLNHYREDKPNPPKVKEPLPSPCLQPKEYNIKEPKEPLKPKEEFKPVIEEPKLEEPPEPPPPYIPKPHFKKPKEPAPVYVPHAPDVLEVPH